MLNSRLTDEPEDSGREVFVLVTDKFTYIHQPKTGGTFVEAMIARLHEARGDLVSTVWFDPSGSADAPDVGAGTVVRLMLSTRNQHGARKDIPAKYQDRPVLATIRNPFDRYVSQYEFAWWRVYPEMFGPVDDVRRLYPAFPNLSFRDFVRLANTACVAYRAANHPDDTPGFHTQQFVEYFFQDPAAAYARLTDCAFTEQVRKETFRGLHFLDQSRLNADLSAFLLKMHYSEDEVDRVLGAGRIWPPEGGRPAGATWEPYYPADLKAFVRQKEQLLFQWFPEFDAA